MKKLPILAAFVISWSMACAQGFEGTIRWTMKMEITDPKMKAQMEEQQKKMNDPENQAKMKEMEAKMNDPQMKAMMEQNPQMKAQMEKMMKMNQGGNPNSMMPSGMVMRLKDGNMINLMEGGMADGMEVLHQKDKAPVRLDRANKTYSAMPTGGGPGGAMTPPKITKTSETAKVLGYSCTKYIAEVMDKGTTTTQVFWTTTEITDIDMKALARQRMGQGGQSLFHEGMDGVPLKMEFSSPQGNMVMECTEMKREKLNAGDFVVPSDFKQVSMPGR